MVLFKFFTQTKKKKEKLGFGGKYTKMKLEVANLSHDSALLRREEWLGKLKLDCG